MIVRYRRRSQEDIENIFDRIAKDNPHAAVRVEDAIRAAGELLAMRPQLGVATGHKDARRWPMPEYDYAIFYRTDWDAACIEVLRVIDGRRVRNLKRVPR